VERETRRKFIKTIGAAIASSSGVLKYAEAVSAAKPPKPGRSETVITFGRTDGRSGTIKVTNGKTGKEVTKRLTVTDTPSVCATNLVAACKSVGLRAEQRGNSVVIRAESSNQAVSISNWPHKVKSRVVNQ
jgi:hypothetical protein